MARKSRPVTPIDSADEHGELQSAKVTNVVKLFASLGGARHAPRQLTIN